jgi:hypothetical protein
MLALRDSGCEVVQLCMAVRSALCLKARALTDWLLSVKGTVNGVQFESMRAAAARVVLRHPS